MLHSLDVEKIGEKLCPRCKKTLPLDKFYKSKQTANGYRSWCKKCIKISGEKHRKKNLKKNRKYQKNYYQNNREHKLKKEALRRKDNPDILKNTFLKSRYGITLEQYNKMCKAQNYKCLICKKKKTLVVDHCHKTKKVRGLLCGTCNRRLGVIEKNIKLLKPMLEYIKIRI